MEKVHILAITMTDSPVAQSDVEEVLNWIIAAPSCLSVAHTPAYDLEWEQDGNSYRTALNLYAATVRPHNEEWVWEVSSCTTGLTTPVQGWSTNEDAAKLNATLVLAALQA